MNGMPRLLRSLSRPLRPVLRPVTYTRWLHLFIAATLALLGAFVWGVEDVPPVVGYAVLALGPVPLLAVAAAIPATRLLETMQARLLLFPGPHGMEAQPDPGLARTPAVSWADRGRVFVWLVLRMWVGLLAAVVGIQGIFLTVALTSAHHWSSFEEEVLPLPGEWHGSYLLLVPVVVPALLAAGWGFGVLIAALAPRLLGPSAAERLAALEERTERLLEHNRLARELHDTIGHALTVAVVQAGAARAAGSPEFTERALGAIEDTGREALEDLERVLRLLRQEGAPPSRRPGLAEAERLVASARGAGAEISAEIEGPLESVPGPVSREGYRIVQECLTNVLRHAGPVPVRVRIAASAGGLELHVRNRLPAAAAPPGPGGSGLRGIRERAALLGGEAVAGPSDGEWRVRVTLPIQ
ncbi:histidine kinase [Streptomyces sp. NBC_01808]|uniref:sensor histidine kinase n=1 Tax=Streptomyces sp. NBC_01808 TaxID=2975947 RepID=UPI002DDC635C|nr:histidine kinase [Streptomyces sp. NBC_01808]WSA36225.1 histidine kinase [Streptomyces sp. NBC_01808]